MQSIIPIQNPGRVPRLATPARTKRKGAAALVSFPMVHMASSICPRTRTLRNQTRLCGRTLWGRTASGGASSAEEQWRWEAYLQVVARNRAKA
eukprot:COSAG01_NODE_3720_length_5764_cov_13.900618_1_plen_93_part_00